MQQGSVSPTTVIPSVVYGGSRSASELNLGHQTVEASAGADGSQTHLSPPSGPLSRSSSAASSTEVRSAQSGSGVTRSDRVLPSASVTYPTAIPSPTAPPAQALGDTDGDAPLDPEAKDRSHDTVTPVVPTRETNANRPSVQRVDRAPSGHPSIMAPFVPPPLRYLHAFRFLLPPPNNGLESYRPPAWGTTQPGDGGADSPIGPGPQAGFMGWIMRMCHRCCCCCDDSEHGGEDSTALEQK